MIRKFKIGYLVMEYESNDARQRGSCTIAPREET